MASDASFLGALRAGFVSDNGTLASSDSQYTITTHNQALLPPLGDLHALTLPPAPATPTSDPDGYKECTGLWLGPASLTAKQRNLTATAAVTLLIASALFRSVPRDTEALAHIVPVSLPPRLYRDVAADEMGPWIDTFKVKLLPTSHDANASSKTTRGLSQQALLEQVQTYLKKTSPNGGPCAGVAILETISHVSHIRHGALGSL
ncbi:hypothetical protein J1614_011114 [Plenodomus biglobosus]|nr:hypothetical protein J1614_011114 [Plenodomus biglobosus]